MEQLQQDVREILGVETNGLSRLLTAEETAHRLNVPTSWIYERSRHDALKTLGMIRVGKYIRFSSDAIEKFISGGGDIGQE